MRPLTKIAAAPAILLLVVFFSVLYFVPLHGRNLWQPDETRYAEISREMARSGDWVVPRLLGIRYFEKPVAGYWINSISQIALGENNFSVRFGSALCTGLNAVLVYFLGMLLWRERETACIAALIYLSMLLVGGIGTYSVLDPMLTLWMSAALLCSHFSLRASTRRTKARAYVLLGLACGMGFLTKGFVALVIPAAASVPIFVLQRRVKELFCYGPLSVLSAVALCAPWSIAIALREPDYWHYFFWVEHVQRFAGEHAQHRAPFWFYLPYVFAGSIPWLGFLPGSIRWSLRESRTRPDMVFLLSWLFMPLLFFSLAKGKLPTYILPCMAPLALLLARYGQDSARGGRRLPVLCNGGINAGIGIAGLFALAVLTLDLLPIPPFFGRQEWFKPVLGAVSLLFWCAAAFLSLLRRSGFWLWAAACPLLAALFIASFLPDVLIAGKQPQPFIHRNKEILRDSRFILSNNVGMAAALAWELKRDDLLMLHDAGELAYGLGYQDSRERLLRKEEVKEWLTQARRQGDVAMFLRVSREHVEPPPYVPSPDYLDRTDRYILLLYKQRAIDP
ncbi:MAG: lipid IV(A) 4-amino-4-deoxy-L-arabinosyltransferase [Desulfovibrio sp.]|jgi:4-amino-4-deoxy-L-arabinose transferase|nr:lipid IV(A) 4-amino-4-deoxy-L-arabinosyltransferase [Desulfovibrio sp.]